MKGRLVLAAVLIVAVALIARLYNAPNQTPSASSSTPSSADTSCAPDRFGDIPEEMRKHIYLSGRAQGSCTRFCGTVTVTAVFVNDDRHTFSSQEQQQYRQQFAALLERIEQDAAAFGANLQLSVQYHTVESTVPLVRDDCDDWVSEVFTLIGVSDPATGNIELAQRYGVQQAPVVMITGQQGRSFAQRSHAERGREYAVLYNDFAAVYHELLHLFGARDFYYPDWVEQLARSLLPESIMSDNSGQVDALTAYLVGWTDTLLPDALSFLQGTAALTDEQLEQAHQQEVFTGYVTDRRSSNGSYTGYLLSGVRHGEGTFVWDSGARYTGGWQNGDMHGFGEYRYKDGDVYTGEWVHGVKEGSGTYTWTDGTVYQGDWKKDARTGQGTMTWQDGAVYQGDFADGERHGHGSYSWPNGDRFVGEWKNGERHGKGTYTWADGTTRTGTWKNGKFVG